MHVINLWGIADCHKYCELSFGALFWTATICYGITLILLLYNTYWYIYRQKRYKSYFVLSFYIFSIIILVTRFLCYLLLVRFYYETP